MPGGDDARLWRARLRWRLRGALQWPLFAGLTVADAVLLQALPLSGRHTDFFAALLLAMFCNLLAVAALGRLAARRLRTRRPDLPRVVAEDRAGSALLVLVSVGLLTAGIAHAPARHAADRAFAAQRAAVRAYVIAHGAAVYRANLGGMLTREQSDGFFRTCVLGDPEAGLPPLCLLIRTDHDPPFVTVDPDRTP
jgi:hypothetical protein